MSFSIKASHSYLKKSPPIQEDSKTYENMQSVTDISTTLTTKTKQVKNKGGKSGLTISTNHRDMSDFM